MCNVLQVAARRQKVHLKRSGVNCQHCHCQQKEQLNTKLTEDRSGLVDTGQWTVVFNFNFHVSVVCLKLKIHLYLKLKVFHFL